MGRYVVKPVAEAVARASGAGMAGGTRRLITPLLHVSTLAWLTGGLALIAAGLWMGPEAQLALGLLVGVGYAYAAAANIWATRARHPGGWLLVAALGLIAVGLSAA